MAFSALNAARDALGEADTVQSGKDRGKVATRAGSRNPSWASDLILLQSTSI